MQKGRVKHRKKHKSGVEGTISLFQSHIGYGTIGFHSASRQLKNSPAFGLKKSLNLSLNINHFFPILNTNIAVFVGNQ